jgi:hypothetical protein
MPPQASDAELVSASEVMETLTTWNRQRTTEELLSFISGRHAQLEDVELGI